MFIAPNKTRIRNRNAYSETSVNKEHLRGVLYLELSLIQIVSFIRRILYKILDRSKKIKLTLCQ